MIKQFVKVYSDAGLTPSEEYFKEHEYMREYFQPTTIMQSSSSTMPTTTRAKYNALVRSRWKPEIIGASSAGRSLKSRYRPPKVSVWKSPQMVLNDTFSTTSKNDLFTTIMPTQEFAPIRATIPRATLPQETHATVTPPIWTTQKTSIATTTRKSPQSKSDVRRVNALSSPHKEEFSTPAKRPNLFGSRKASDIVRESLFVPRPQRPRELT